MTGGAGEDGLKVIDGEGELGFPGHGEEVEDGVGGSGGGGDAGDGVFKGDAGADIAGEDVFANGVEDDFAAAVGDGVLARIDLGDAGGVHGGEAD